MEANNSAGYNERINKEAPQLIALLKEMKQGLDNVRSKVQALTEKVKANRYPTADGISYLEAKHLLLLTYCQSIVYYLLRKAKGFSIEGHPIVRSLVEIRLFLEKIQPIDKKHQYQIQKLTKAADGVPENVGSDEKKSDSTQKTEEDLLKFRPNPDMLIKNSDETNDDGRVGPYKPPKIAPTIMPEEKSSREVRNKMRREERSLLDARKSDYVREMRDDLEGRPEEVREIVGTESREVSRYIEKMNEQHRLEEEHFIRVPVTRLDKKKEKHLKKSRNGLAGLTDGFYDEIKSLHQEGDAGEDWTGGFANNGSSKGRKFKKQKRRN